MSKLEGEADKVDEVRLNYVLYFSVFYFLLDYQCEMYEGIFFNKYMHQNKYNVVDDSDDGGGVNVCNITHIIFVSHCCI